MKYIKYYEHSIKDELQINNFVSCREDSNETDINLKNYIKDNIGKIFKYNPRADQYLIEFNYAPDNLKGRFTKRNGKYLRWFSIDNIVEFDKSIDKLKLKIQSNKFNI